MGRRSTGQKDSELGDRGGLRLAAAARHNQISRQRMWIVGQTYWKTYEGEEPAVEVRSYTLVGGDLVEGRVFYDLGDFVYR